MPSIPSHVVAAFAIGSAFPRSAAPRVVVVAGAICSIVPDMDVIGFHFGIRYGDFWGHRGFTHSLLFAGLLASAATFALLRSVVPGLSRFGLWSYIFLATASHGLLDAMTDGGQGVAFFSPFGNSRYFLPWTPIHVSPIGLTRFLSRPGVVALRSELLVIWLPSILFVILTWLIRRGPSARTPALRAIDK